MISMLNVISSDMQNGVGYLVDIKLSDTEKIKWILKAKDNMYYIVHCSNYSYCREMNEEIATIIYNTNWQKISMCIFDDNLPIHNAFTYNYFVKQKFVLCVHTGLLEKCLCSFDTLTQESKYVMKTHIKKFLSAYYVSKAWNDIEWDEVCERLIDCPDDVFYANNTAFDLKIVDDYEKVSE